ncbi:RasGEF domain-containing protein [Microdochium trichocladiopsis]|uniref:RasGEF domain-containing protein n=1 Tax=Microdochium trichocladiopsis TaxID=1682393 RepID=A0A9P9BU22_9PEZI|nr:RasGEF domain-containing protein [Microdochium trichocladiopsis]KAH7040571.1 RasGEF domain-containing protein [Microdochium trichocladiopsis]
MMLDHQNLRASLQVAPLAIQKLQSHGDYTGENADQHNDSTGLPYSATQPRTTPPTTPNTSQEALVQQIQPIQPVFHNFLRAFYPFNPTGAMSDSTVTLPLNEGDVVLVHSIHTNGWADGTLLLNGARGWLPTNYCESYNPEEIRNLLNALLNFWDLLRSTATNDQDIFGNQEFMKGIIAGVRCLLERTHSLTRESPIIQRSEILRRGRKSLLSELSSLVKIAKALQEILTESLPGDDHVNDMIDEMILRAFKIVLKGVWFLDLLEDDRRSRATAAVTVMATVLEESAVPPTPPADAVAFSDSHKAQIEDNNQRDAQTSGRDESSSREQSQTALGHRRLSSVRSLANAGRSTAHSQHRPGSRVSATISHRVSLAGLSSSTQPQNLISERLNANHDTFLSYLGSFIGRLHLQSQSRPELAMAIKQSAISGVQLVVVVNAVIEHNPLVADSLDQACGSMLDRIRDLVYSAQMILQDSGPESEDIIVAQDNSHLLSAATNCVKAAGECVAKTKWAIERVGDFEVILEAVDYQSILEVDLEELDTLYESKSRPSTAGHASVAESRTCESMSDSVSTMSRSVVHAAEKPLPDIPVSPSGATDEVVNVESPIEEPAPQTEPVGEPDAEMPTHSISSRQSLPPLPRLITSALPDMAPNATLEDSRDIEGHGSFRSDTFTASSSGTNSTYLSRDSEASLLSETSTRATTPDIALAPKPQPSLSNLSAAASSSASEEVDDVETRLMEKTFAHELMFNKEGQVTAGSLPALVERLTAHESTPDAAFVSTFYLTFRLFCTPVKFSEALIERFDCVAETPHIANPVRLRVYNILKGWLESHWRYDSDHIALPAIQAFAETKLSSVLPAAGKRLSELATKVATADCALVPRLVSSMGKTSSSISQYMPPDTPLPNPVVSRSQQGLLNNWKAGGTLPSILDLEPLEIARQLTLRQMNIFCAILPDELLGSQWMKKGGVDSPNVKSMSGFSTDLSNLVAETILQHPEVKKRAAVIKQWIKIANHCFELNNYDGLMAIICSLNSSIIIRLRKTWDLLSVKRREMLKKLQGIVEPANNNKVLRARLQGHVPPCLPFLGMFLTDLTFVDIGNPATKQLPGNDSNDRGLTVVNYDKHMRTARIIGELQRFQIPYRLSEVSDIQDWLQAQVDRLKESDQSNVQVTYYRKSLLLEPRDTASRIPQDATSTGNNAAPRSDFLGSRWLSRNQHSNATTTS